jgi:membrane protein DedA with SNARE-associated domain
MFGEKSMLQFVFDFLNQCGLWGLFASTAIEASSLPFPGAVFVLIYGFIMDVNSWQLFLIGLANSMVFTLFAMIPYAIGYRLEKFSKKKFNTEKIAKAQIWFQKYGEWGITLSRPLSIGNYVSYIAGLTRIRPWRFIFFTFLGACPWNITLLFIGHSSSLAGIQRFLKVLGNFGTIVTISIVIIGLVWFFIWRYRQKSNNSN